jgi:hypothetical protein
MLITCLRLWSRMPRTTPCWPVKLVSTSMEASSPGLMFLSSALKRASIVLLGMFLLSLLHLLAMLILSPGQIGSFHLHNILSRPEESFDVRLPDQNI